MEKKKEEVVVFDFSVEDFDVINFLGFNGSCDVLYSFRVNLENELFQDKKIIETTNMRKNLEIQIKKKEREKKDLEIAGVLNDSSGPVEMSEDNELIHLMTKCGVKHLGFQGNFFKHIYNKILIIFLSCLNQR